MPSLVMLSAAAAAVATAAVPAIGAATQPPHLLPPRRGTHSQAHPLPFSASVVLVLKSERCLHFYTYMYA